MTPCETAAGLLPDYWQNQLATPERAADGLWLRQHLESCSDCAGMAAMWERMAALPAPVPDARARQRFDQMLAAYAAGMEMSAAPPSQILAKPRRANWFAGLAWSPMPAMAAAALLAVGLAGGWLLHQPTRSNDAQQIAELRDQVQSTRQLAVLSLLQQSSANERLQGVTYSARLKGDDPQVTSALLRSLKYDPSPDVRLAVVDTLTQYGAQPEVRAGLVDAFHYQKSPLVQIALMDSFLETRDQQAHNLLETISKDATYTPEVRQRAAWSLAQPAWN